MAEYVCEDMGLQAGGGTAGVRWHRKERVVRCRDCSMYDAEDGMCLRDPEHTGRGWYANPDGFCAWGNPMEE